MIIKLFITKKYNINITRGILIVKQFYESIIICSIVNHIISFAQGSHKIILNSIPNENRFYIIFLYFTFYNLYIYISYKKRSRN
jgi:hypothetical protein